MNAGMYMLISAKIGNHIAENIPLLPGQEVVEHRIDNSLDWIAIDLGDEKRATKAQLEYLANDPDTVIVRIAGGIKAQQPASTTCFGLLLMLVAIGAAAFLDPRAIPVIVGVFLLVWVCQKLRAS